MLIEVLKHHAPILLVLEVFVFCEETHRWNSLALLNFVVTVFQQSCGGGNSACLTNVAYTQLPQVRTPFCNTRTLWLHYLTTIHLSIRSSTTVVKKRLKLIQIQVR